jgi:parvulin-like peptidyl-prolyl isomerase
VGTLSEPIKAPSAYHVVRMEERRPSHQQTFDEVGDSIMRDLRARYVTEQREMRIKAINEDPDLQVNQAAIDGLVNHIDPQKMQPPRRERSKESASK